MFMIQTPVATITLVDGRPLDLQALPPVLERYGYVRSGAEPTQWILPDWGDAPDTQAGLTFADDGRAIKLYSRCPQNIANVNFVAATAGWLACACYAVDAAVELLVLEQFAHVRPARLQISGEAPLDLTQRTAESRGSAINVLGSATPGDSIALGRRIADELAHVNRRLAVLAGALEQSSQSVVAQTTTAVDASFSRLVESLAGLSQIRSTPVARMLREHGYEVALTVVRVS